MANLKRSTCVAAAVGLAAIVSLPGMLHAFSLIGGNLGIATGGNGYQRDVRIFNNAADAAANDNQVAEANHPGALGAALSVWKASQAWNSDTIEAVRNFDYDWQDTNTSSAPNQNTVSWGSSGCGGGVLAYTETPISDGWRILNCESWVWSDGPGNPTFNQFDIQGVDAHELGHALGLGHSTFNCGNCNNTATGAASMCSFICNNGTTERTLSSDDQNGLNAVYGAIPANKPLITALSGSTSIGGTLVISGSNFAPTVNVKFTAGTSTNTGAIPGVVTGVSTTGNQLSVTVPAGALDGNVFVWDTTNSRLSNGFPIDIGTGPTCPIPTVYCTAKINSQFCAPAIGFSGTPSFSAGSGFFVTASQMLNNKNGLLFYSLAPAALPFQGSFLCAQPPIKRTSVQNSAGNAGSPDCSGTYSFDFNAYVALGTDPNLLPSSDVYAQYWARDPADLSGFATSLSDALQFNLCP
jgi:hypothetical protein